MAKKAIPPYSVNSTITSWRQKTVVRMSFSNRKTKKVVASSKIMISKDLDSSLLLETVVAELPKIITGFLKYQ